ncbi:DUF1318 domain-containing protein [Azoarcus indigens]|uniref:DUF1318 domain-containing protein n=1 Tax=Azoarcus indigens TaxID=29545 RepID=A0A4R6DVQ2_9RHOO|nr:YdbL family protein [Azoarcus indigens]NMG64306.1 DUF1318 domain-containing protein [Azoarcus indigens]TDN49243.1 hypothetical protein C7389_11298 [Azoarcus indigens]
MKALKWLSVVLLLGASLVLAQGNLDVSSPAISALKRSMQERHAQLAPLYDSGALGQTTDGGVAVRDASAVPLAQRAQATALVAAENADRSALYREIARANGHPEWEADVRRTFAGRWAERARAGWWIQQDGNWVRK